MQKRKKQLIWGLLFGVIFGFLLQKGGVTKYDVIIGQILLTDFTVVKVMLSAVITGMLGLHILQKKRLVKLHPKEGSWGKNAIGGLIFGLGFALLGYCPGTIAGAIGNGFLDAATAGLAGILCGSALLAIAYPRLQNGILKMGYFGDITLPKLFKVNEWIVIIPLTAVLVLILYLIELSGL